MARRVPRNAPCPCGSGKKYKLCCYGRDYKWVEADDGQVSRRVPLSKGTVEMLHDFFVRSHGREPGPHDRVFDGAPPLEWIEHQTIEAMKRAGKIYPALIYAHEKTGLLLSAANRDRNVRPVTLPTGTRPSTNTRGRQLPRLRIAASQRTTWPPRLRMVHKGVTDFPHISFPFSANFPWDVNSPVRRRSGSSASVEAVGRTGSVVGL